MNFFRLFFRFFTTLTYLFLFLLLTGGCSSTPQPVKEVFMHGIQLIANPQANENTAIAVDFVISYNADLTNTLMQLSAFKYFDQKKQLLRDNPDTLQVLSWEIVPGQALAPTYVTYTGPYPQAGIFFANYLSPGDHRIRAGKQTDVYILLGKEDFSLQPLSVSTSGS